jgi:hypothetical protein
LHQLGRYFWTLVYFIHRRQNTKKKFGSGDGNTPLTCLWMYNILVKCSSVAEIQFLKQKYEVQMKPAHLAYLTALNSLTAMAPYLAPLFLSFRKKLFSLPIFVPSASHG